MIQGDDSADDGELPVDGDILGDDSAEEACERQRVELRMKFRREGPVFIVAFFPAWLDFGKIGSSLLRRRSEVRTQLQVLAFMVAHCALGPLASLALMRRWSTCGAWRFDLALVRFSVTWTTELFGL